jgi:hypothetical protein
MKRFPLQEQQPRASRLQPMRQQQQQSTSPSAIQAWAAGEAVILQAAAAAVTNLGTGVLALDGAITAFQNSPGTISPADQAALDAIQASSNALVTQAKAISTTPPGQAVPLIPIPPAAPSA